MKDGTYGCRAGDEDDDTSLTVGTFGRNVDEVFDYASFMWDSGDFWQQVSPDLSQNSGLEAHMLVSLTPFSHCIS